MSEVPPTLQRIRKRDERAHALSRRQFLQLVAASGAVSVASGCAPNAPEKILPYVRRPLDVSPGKSTHYATSVAIDGFATGLLVKTREGRPIKVEGNPAHPASLGATSIFHQASVWQLYDPDRARGVVLHQQPASWSRLEAALRAQRSDHGAGLRILLEPTSSPLVHAQLAAIKQRYPECKQTFYSPVPSQVPGAASLRAFGRVLSPQYDLASPQLIVALDADPLTTPYPLRYARDLTAGRDLSRPDAERTRVYAVESAMSTLGSVADNRLRRASRRVAPVAAALARAIMAGTWLSGAQPPQLDPEERAFVDALARDLLARPAGQTLVIAGERQPLEVHVLVYGINARLGNLGHALRFTEQAVPDSVGDQDLASLAQEMQRGAVDTAIILAANPAYDAPADLGWSASLQRVSSAVYCGAYYNETAKDCAWVVPLSHPFESWGDGLAYDGTLSFTQPLIRPLYDSKSISEVLGALAQEPRASDHARLRVRFGASYAEGLTLAMSVPERAQREQRDARLDWEAALEQGFVAGTSLPAVEVTVHTEAVAQAFEKLAAQPSAAGLELNLLKSPTLYDGRFANVSWLLELPEPITKLTWDNALLMSPSTARKLGLPDASPRDDDSYPMVELTRGGRSLRAPLLCVPSHADDSASLWLGYGRSGSERLARGVGVNAYLLRTHGAEHFASDLQIRAVAETYPLAITQLHQSQHERPLALTVSLAAYRREPDFTAEQKGPLPSLLTDYKQAGPQWAMSIDLGLCTGCNACVVACQAENNVMVVGKEQVRRGRAMHWIRIDAYSLPEDATRIVHQPMLCQHCENAPCEVVCPVNATEHSPDGLNEMVYNRCVGTRFCSNNCPYKVRRFNWFNWVEEEQANQGPVELQRNPEVTVRQRGVMEKCSYCVQRIRAAEIEARIEQREIRAGEVVTACQQACPSRAITFGSLTHSDTPMVKWRQEPRSYAVLHETGARPRTQYLARIANPNPELG